MAEESTASRMNKLGYSELYPGRCSRRTRCSRATTLSRARTSLGLARETLDFDRVSFPAVGRLAAKRAQAVGVGQVGAVRPTNTDPDPTCRAAWDTAARRDHPQGGSRGRRRWPLAPRQRDVVHEVHGGGDGVAAHDGHAHAGARDVHVRQVQDFAALVLELLSSEV